MKATEISVSISHNLNVGAYESVRPMLTVTAELEKGDDPEDTAKELHQMASKMWAKQALVELSWVAKRRTGDKKHEYNEVTAGTRAQLKSML